MHHMRYLLLWLGLLPVSLPAQALQFDCSAHGGVNWS